MSPKPDLSVAEYPEEYLAFIKLFNDEKFFEAHEVLESRWRLEPGEARDFYHGLIQIAAIFVHIRKGTPQGGKNLLKTARKYLGKYSPTFMNLNLRKLLAETEACLLADSKVPRIFLKEN